MKTQQYLENKKYSLLIFIACFAAYTSSYIGRINFSAALPAIIGDGLFTKSQAGIIGSAFFFVYGAFQIINGFLGDKISPFKMIIAGTFLSGIANVGMSFCSSNISMAIIWGFNGFATECVVYANGSLAVQDLVNGNIQYVIIDSAPAKCITEAFNN